MLINGRFQSYCRSYSPLPVFLSTVNPAFLASMMDNGLSFMGENTLEMIFRTGLRQAGHCFSSGALRGRRSVNFPPQTTQLPSQSSYS